MTHKRNGNSNNGDVVRVINFMDYKYPFDMYNAFGQIQHVPDAIFRGFFFEPTGSQRQRDDVFVDVIASQQMQNQWQNQHIWTSKFLDLKIHGQGVEYEINIPAGHVTEVIPLSGQIQLPESTKLARGAYLNKDCCGLIPEDTFRDQTLRFHTTSDETQLLLLLKQTSEM